MMHLKAMSVSFLDIIYISIQFSCEREYVEISSLLYYWYSISVRQAHLRSMLFSVLKMVLLFPSRIVPPICPGLCSGMSITCEVTNQTQANHDICFIYRPEMHFLTKSDTHHRIFSFWVKFCGVGI